MKSNAPITALEDTLGEASSFAQAVFLAAAGLPDGRDTCAFQMLAEEIEKRLTEARNLIDGLREDGR